MASPTAAFRNRIVGFEDIAVSKIVENVNNWRTHSKEQLEPLLDVLASIGQVQNIVVNQQTGLLIDGHARVLLARQEGQMSLMATIVDLSPEEEIVVLATLDPLSTLAGRDDVKLKALLDKVPESDKLALNVMIADLRELTSPGVELARAETDAKQRSNPYQKQAENWQHGEGQSKSHVLSIVVPVADWDGVTAQIKALGAAWGTETITDTCIKAIALCYQSVQDADKAASISVTMPSGAVVTKEGPVYHVDLPPTAATALPAAEVEKPKGKRGRKEEPAPVASTTASVQEPAAAGLEFEV